MYGSELLEVRVEFNSVTFRTHPQQGFVTIDNIQLSKAGVLREFPDLKDQPNWRIQATERFRDKIKSYKTEQEKIDYIIEDLKNYGYIAKHIQKGGQRVKHLG